MSRPCRWPDGGCGAEIIDVVTIAGRKQVLDAKPGKGVVLVRENDPLVIAGQSDLDSNEYRARVVPIWIDHHATCAAWAAKVERERAAKQRVAP